MFSSQKLTDQLNKHSSRRFQLKETVFSPLFALFPREYLCILREFQILPRSSARSAEQKCHKHTASNAKQTSRSRTQRTSRSRTERLQSKAYAPTAEPPSSESEKVRATTSATHHPSPGLRADTANLLTPKPFI